MPEQPSMLPDQPPDLNQQIAELERELKVRRSVYPGWVAAGKIEPQVADYRIQCMEATLKLLRDFQRFNNG